MLFLLLLAISGVYSAPHREDTIPRDQETCGYESCPKPKDGFLNVHIVPHTHDDVGWLKTVDQYYYGSRNNIQKAGVQYILDSVIKELWEDPKRRFIYVETAFFWKWWVRQSLEIQDKVHALVRQGRLQFVGGAWSMNDEAASHYQSTIDQFTYGLSKLNDTFGYCGLPRVGWQIDPFGHSREFASLLAMMGYDGLFLGRIDYQDKRRRLETKTMEMVWRGNDALGKASDIFTGVLHNTYSPPPGFCFDVLCNDEPIIDDPESPMNNVDTKIPVFIDYVKNQSRHYRTDNAIITMGGDFTYQDAHMWYNNLDKLIKYTNLVAAKDNLNITLFYSTPNCYLKAVKDANPTLPTKEDDFFPYASDPTAYWTGYFTSRPTTKYFEREANGYLQVFKQLQVLANLDKHNMFVLNELKSAMGVMQHHDAITGTEKQHVTHDYERILNQAVDDASLIAKEAFNKLIRPDPKSPLLDFQRCRLNESSCEVSENSDTFIVTIYNPLGWLVREPIRIPVVEGTYDVIGPDGKPIDTQIVPLSKSVLSIPTRNSKATKEIVFITEINALTLKTFFIKKTTREKRENFKYYINIDEYFDNIKKEPEMQFEKYSPKFEESSPNVEKSSSHQKSTRINTETDSGVEIVPEIRKPILEPIPKDSEYCPPQENIETSDLEILRDTTDDQALLALEKLINLRKKPSPTPRIKVPRENEEARSEKSLYSKLNEEELRMLSDEPMVVERFEDEVELSNLFFNIRVNKATGEITHISYPDGSRLKFTVGVYYYPGAEGQNSKPSDRASGAYIFRPNATSPIKFKTTKSSIVNGDIVKEFRVDLEPKGHINTKMYTNLNYIENEFVLGPIPIEDDVGKEYIIKYETDMLNNGEFYTDSNGRQVLKRKLNYRPQWNVTLAEPIAGNYYPVTNEIYIKNDAVKVTVLTDRSQGGSSLIEGEIELMVHRRLLHDDAFGVGEALNETAMGTGLVVRGKHRIFITKNDEETRKNVLNMHLPPYVTFAKMAAVKFDDWLKFNNDVSLKQNELPYGIHLLTLEPWGDKLLIRLENYLDSKSQEIDLNSIVKGINITNVRETLLAANVWADDYEKWMWNGDSPIKQEKEQKSLVYNLKAKEIKSFIVDYKLK